jgi:hypothetical protein
MQNKPDEQTAFLSLGGLRPPEPPHKRMVAVETIYPG